MLECIGEAWRGSVAAVTSRALSSLMQLASGEVEDIAALPAWSIVRPHRLPAGSRALFDVLLASTHARRLLVCFYYYIVFALLHRGGGSRGGRVAKRRKRGKFPLVALRLVFREFLLPPACVLCMSPRHTYVSFENEEKINIP